MQSQDSDAGRELPHTASGAIAARSLSSSASVNEYGVQVCVSVVTWFQKALQQSIVRRVSMGTMMFRSMHIAPSSSRTWPGAWSSSLKTGRQPLKTSFPVENEK